MNKLFLFPSTVQSFIMECVHECIEKQNDYENFWPFIEHIRPLILANREIKDVLAFISSGRTSFGVSDFSQGTKEINR